MIVEIFVFHFANCDSAASGGKQWKQELPKQNCLDAIESEKMSRPVETLQRDMLLERFSRDMVSKLRPKAMQIDKLRLGPIGGMTLITLAGLPPVSLHDLSALLARDKSQVTKLVQLLHRKKLVSVLTDANDRRIKLVTLTEKGRNFTDELSSAWREVNEEVLSPLTERQRTQLLDLLSILYPTES